MAEKRKYWFKLERNFFSDKVVRKMRMTEDGDKCAIIALELMLIALDNEGMLFYERIEDTFEEECALELNEDVNAVTRTVRMMLAYGWMEKQDDYSYIVTKAQELAGSETSAAERMRRSRSNRNNAVTDELQKDNTPEQLNENVTEDNTDVTEECNNVRNSYVDVTDCYDDVHSDVTDVTGRYTDVTEYKEEKRREKNNNPSIQASSNHIAGLRARDGRTDGRIFFSDSFSLSVDEYKDLCKTFSKSHTDDYAQRIADGIDAGRMEASSNPYARLKKMLANAKSTGLLDDPDTQLSPDDDLDEPKVCPECGRRLDADHECKECGVRFEWDGILWKQTTIPTPEGLKAMSDQLTMLAEKFSRKGVG